MANRTNTNPFQSNRRTSLLNSQAREPKAGSFGNLGGVPISAVGQGEPAQVGPQQPRGVPTQGVMQGPQRAVLGPQQAPVQGPQMSKPQLLEQKQQQVNAVPVSAATQGGAAPTTRSAQGSTAQGIPVQPGGQTTGGIPVGSVTPEGIQVSSPRSDIVVAQQQADALRAQSAAPGDRAGQLEQTINDIQTQQERQLRETSMEAGERGIIRPFVQGLQGDIAAAGAEQAAPLQRELGALREQEDREFQRGIQLRQLALQEAAAARAAGRASGSSSVEQEAAGQTSNEILRLVNKLKDSGALGNATGLSGKIPARPGTKKFDFVQDFTRLESLLTVDNLDLMSGVLTDKDLEILRGAATSLNRGQSAAAFTDELNRIGSIQFGGSQASFAGPDLSGVSAEQMAELQALGLIQ